MIVWLWEGKNIGDIGSARIIKGWLASRVPVIGEWIMYLHRRYIVEQVVWDTDKDTVTLIVRHDPLPTPEEQKAAYDAAGAEW